MADLFNAERPAATTAAGPLAPKFGDERLSLRFWSKVVEEASGCWLWVRETDHDGYGRFRVGSTKPVAHRVAYEVLVGPVAAGLQLDHLCRVRNCVRPTHLEPVTNRVNTLRGEGPTARNAAKTECPQGHPYDTENTQIRPSGRRRCRACARAESARRHAARKAVRNG